MDDDWFIIVLWDSSAHRAWWYLVKGKRGRFAKGRCRIASSETIYVTLSGCKRAAQKVADRFDIPLRVVKT